MLRALVAPLALLLLLAGTVAAVTVPDQRPDAFQDESGKLNPQQVQALSAALGGLTHARFKAVLLSSLGSDPDATLDAFWAAWQPGADAVLMLAGADGGRLRVQLGQNVGRGIDLTATAREYYNPKAGAGDTPGALQALAGAIEAHLEQAGAPALTPQKPATGADKAVKAEKQPWRNPLAGVEPRYWWLLAAVVQAVAAVLLALWGTADSRRRRRSLR